MSMKECRFYFHFQWFISFLINWEDILEPLFLPSKSVTESNLCLNDVAVVPFCLIENFDTSKAFYENVSRKLGKKLPTAPKMFVDNETKSCYMELYQTIELLSVLHHWSYSEKYFNSHKNNERYRFGISQA